MKLSKLIEVMKFWEEQFDKYGVIYIDGVETMEDVRRAINDVCDDKEIELFGQKVSQYDINELNEIIKLIKSEDKKIEYDFDEIVIDPILDF